MTLLATALVLAVFGTVLARQLAGSGPPLYLVFLGGGLAFVALGVLSPGGAEQAIAAELPVLVFLFSLFVFAAALERSGALEHLARWVVGRAKRPEDLPFVIFVGFGLLSAFLVNDALVLLGVPILFSVARTLRSEVRPLLLTLAYAVTVGSVLTPIGNPQNLLIASASGLPTPIATFLRYLLLPTVINLLVGGLYVRHRFGRSLAPPLGAREPPHTSPLIPSGDWLPRLHRNPVLWVFPGTILVLFTTDLTAAITGGPTVPLYAITAGGAMLTLALGGGRSRALEDVDWSILLLFVGLFVVVAGAVSGGVVGELQSTLPIPPPGDPGTSAASAVLSSLLGAQLFSNVPWVTLEIPVLHGLGYSSGTPIAWIALAAGSTLAGNVTLLGAASNLIVVRQAEKLGVRLPLGAFVRDGLPISAFTILIVLAFLWIGW